MGLTSGIYDSDFIQPLVKIKESLALFTGGKWAYFMNQFMEPIQPGPASIIDTVALSGATQIAANATIAKQAIAVLQMQSNDFFHCRWEPLDNVEGLIWEQTSVQRFALRNVTSRTDRRVRLWDPNLTTTTFGILGFNRDMNLETRNPMAYALPSARFVFFGYRYILAPIDTKGINPDQQRALDVGDANAIRQIIGTPVTFFPAEGRAA